MTHGYLGCTTGPWRPCAGSRLAGSWGPRNRARCSTPTSTCPRWTARYCPTMSAPFSPPDNRRTSPLVGSNEDEGAALLKHFTRFMGTGVAGFSTFAGAMLPEVKAEIETRYPAATDVQAMQSWADHRFDVHLSAASLGKKHGTVTERRAPVLVHLGAADSGHGNLCRTTLARVLPTPGASPQSACRSFEPVQSRLSAVPARHPTCRPVGRPRRLKATSNCRGP